MSELKTSLSPTSQSFIDINDTIRKGIDDNIFKTDEPFEFTFTDPNSNQSVTVTLTKEDVGLTAGENLNTLSQQRETGKIRIVENQILTRIFSKFKDSGLIKDRKKTKDVNPNDEERGDGDPNAQYKTS